MNSGTPFQQILDETDIRWNRQVDAGLASLMRRHQMSISVAEGFTTGHVGKKLGELLSLDQLFMGGVICSSPLLMIQLGGVNPRTIRDKGSACKDVAFEMAEHIRAQSKSKIGVSNAGHMTLSEDKKPGTFDSKFHVGFAFEKQTVVKSFETNGSRELVYEECVQSVLLFLKQYIPNQI